jgi:hypothetical protein
VTRALRRKRKLWKQARCGPEELRKYREAGGKCGEKR